MDNFKFQDSHKLRQDARTSTCDTPIVHKKSSNCEANALHKLRRLDLLSPPSQNLFDAPGTDIKTR